MLSFERVRAAYQAFSSVRALASSTTAAASFSTSRANSVEASEPSCSEASPLRATHGSNYSSWVRHPDSARVGASIEWRSHSVRQDAYRGVLVDAAGTLLVPSEPAANVYLRYASPYNVKLSPDEVLYRYRRYGISVGCSER